MKDKLRELAEWMRSINGHCAYALTEIIDAEGDGGTVENSHARMIHAFPKLSEFFVKHALGSKLPVSCFACGHVGDRSITHAELADIYICKVCADKLGDHSARSGVVSDDAMRIVTKMLEDLAKLDEAACVPVNRPNLYAPGWNDCRAVVLTILDAEEGGYWPDGSDAPIRDYTPAQPTELEDAVREVISLLRSTSIGEANQRIVADKLTAALQPKVQP